MKLLTPDESHRQSLFVLNAFQEYDDFMESIVAMVDLGCGEGLDLEWWATRTTRDDSRTPLNIKCVGVDLLPMVHRIKKYANATYQNTNFENTIIPPVGYKFDVLWCHDAFQYCVNPLQTLVKWREVATPSAMLALTVPRTINFTGNRTEVYTQSGCYYHYTLVNLMYMLAVSGWDCRNGFFYQSPDMPWIHAVVYNSPAPAQNPQTCTWYNLVDQNMLPDSANSSILKHGYLRQQDLILKWLDQSFHIMNQQ